jgi:SAM-dependent methyltransferase
MSDNSAPQIFSPEYYARMRELEAGAWWNAGMRDIAAALLAKAELPQTGTMIDAGCGSGQTMAWFLSSHASWQSYGCDIAIEGVRGAATSHLKVAQGDVANLPLRRSFADLVISFDVIQHLPLDRGDLGAMSEFFRVLKPGGYLLIRTNAQSWPHSVDDPANNFRKYSPALLSERLSQSGFEIDILSRANALLGLAEIPREAKASKEIGCGYHGILAEPNTRPGVGRSLKRGMLRMEAVAIANHMKLPFGRSIVALARKPERPADKSKQNATP